MFLASELITNLEVQVLPPIWVIGNRKEQAGFALVEVLVVLLIISITFGLISVSFFSTEESEWKDINRRLIVSLNHSKDEATLSGAPIVFQIDEKGWRFLAPNLQDEFYILGAALTPYFWKRQTKIEGTMRFYLEEPGSTPGVLFKIIQGSLTSTIHRRRDGYFELH
jgi:type II secretion system protein H